MDMKVKVRVNVRITCRVQNLDIPLAGRVGAHSGVAGPGRAGLFANRIVRLGNNPSLLSPIENVSPDVSPEARTSEILCKPTEERNPRLTTGSSVVYHWDERRSFSLAADQWNDAFSSLLNPFHARHVREFIRPTG